jgi:excisionase family DNA binding protein
VSHADHPSTTAVVDEVDDQVDDDDVAVLTLNEVASLLRVSRSTVKRLINSGQLAAFHVGSSVRVPLSAVEGYIAHQRIEPMRPHTRSWAATHPR